MLKTKKRFLYMIAMGLAISLLFQFFILKEHDRHSFPLFHYIAILLGTIIISEGNLQIDNTLNKHYTWVTHTKKRLIYQIVACFLFTFLLLVILLFIGHLVLDRPNERHPKGIDPLFYIGVVFSFSALTIEITTQFFRAWKQSLIEVERYKTESANAQLQNLKNQLNPHFLFNNLSVLTSLIYSNQDKAVAFINELSKVYRYALDSKSWELVTLKEELDFLYHYIYLLKIRFDSSINFSFSIDENAMNSYLPPMCLQMLVENTIQHNEASQANPLKVSIFTTGDFLSIENPLLKRSDENKGSGMGLKNIQSRYAFFTNELVKVKNDGKSFRVSLPLIPSK